MIADSGESIEPLYELAVRSSLDVFTVRGAVRHAAESIGFARPDCAELAIAASELTTNILKYGVVGTVRIFRIRSATLGPGVRIAAQDQGPPFRDFETALLDHHDDRGLLDVDARRLHRGLASGLGAVVRFTHELTYEPSEVGKTLWATRYLRKPPRRAP